MIYICIPAFNEEQTVGVVLWKIRQVMAEYPRDYQLLVVDDASTDKTPEVLAPYARVLPLTVVRAESRQGEGGAWEMMLREAVRRSEYPKRDIIITLQADFTQEPDELVALIKRMEAGADIVTGETTARQDDTFWSRLARRLALRLLGRGRIPAGVRDPFTGYRAYRVAVVKSALADRKGRLVHWGGWAGAAELLLATSPHARRIDTVELVDRRERLQRPSRLRPWRALRDVWSLAREARPIQVASPAELDHAMRSVAAERTSEVAARGATRDRTERSDRSPRPERGRGSGEERRTREARPSRGGPQGAGQARPARGERPTHAGAAERAHKGGEDGRSAAGRGPRKPAEPRKPQPAAPEPVTAEVPEAVLLTDSVGAVPGSAPERTRRKRPRRRKRAGGSAAEAGNDAQAVAPAPLAADAPEPGSFDAPLPSEKPVATSASLELLEAPLEGVAGVQDETGAAGGEAGEAGETAPRSRRRRRGRRGGRRRSGNGGTVQEGEEAAGGGGGETTAVAESPGAVRELDATEQLAILELIEGDRSDDR